MTENTQTNVQEPFRSDDSIRGTGFGSKLNASKPEPSSPSNQNGPRHADPNRSWRLLFTVVLAGIVAYTSYAAISQLRTRKASSISPEQAKELANKIVIHPIPLPPHPHPPHPVPPPPKRGLPLGVLVALDLLAIVCLAYLWKPGAQQPGQEFGVNKDEQPGRKPKPKRGKTVYEGRVHGGGREFTLTPADENGESLGPVEVRVQADWAQAYIHDGDRIQVHGKWKKQFWKQRWWVEAKRVYNFTTGANWDGKTGHAAAGQ